MNNRLTRIKICAILFLVFLLPLLGIAQSQELLKEPDMIVGDMPISFLYLMGGEYDKAIDRLANDLPEVERIHGRNSLYYLYMQYNQWLCYRFLRLEAQAREVQLAMNASAIQLPEDSLIRHLQHKNWLDAQLYATLISGAGMGANLSESDDPLMRALGSASILDPQEINRKIAAVMEISQKYEGDEEAMQEEMMMEMIVSIYGEQGAEDIAEMMQFSEESAGINNQEALDKLLKMEDNFLISPYVQQLRALQKLDENSSLDEWISLLSGESTAEGKLIDDILREAAGDEEGQGESGNLEQMFDEDHIINSINSPIIQQLEGEDKTMIASLLAAGMKGAMVAEMQSTANGIELMAKPIGFDETHTISNSEFEDAMQQFDLLSEEEKVNLEAKLLEKLRQRDQLKGKIKFSSHSDVYNQLSRFYTADGRYVQAAHFLQKMKDAVVEYWTIMNEQLKFTMEDMNDEEDLESDAYRLLLRLENQISFYSSLIYNFVMEYQEQSPALADFAYNAALHDKAFVLEKKRNLRASALSSEDMYLRQIATKWLEYRGEQASRLQSGQEDKALVQRLELLEQEMNRYDSELLQTDWKTVQHALKPAEAAIEFIQFYETLEHPYEEGSQKYGRKQLDYALEAIDQKRHYAAVVLLPEGPHPYFVPLTRQANLDSIPMDKLIQNLKQRYPSRGATPVGATPVVDDAGQQIYSLIWEPLEKYLQNTQRAYYSPAGSLNQLAFAALPSTDGLLIDQYELWQVSSSRQIVNNTALEKPVSAALFGGIHYDAVISGKSSSKRNRGAQSSISPQPLKPLEGTKKEVNRLSSLLASHAISTDLFTGSQAEEKKLLGISSPSILHIATHGSFEPDTVNELMMQTDQAMLRSWLAFAGINQTRQKKHDSSPSNDGKLFAAEAAQLNLLETQLVVLSACETGLGENQGSEGVYGLQRAFREAGAQFLIMSLWKVPDAETQQLMELFYQNWLSEGLEIRQAFRKAQLTMQQQYAPYAWAGFVLVE